MAGPPPPACIKMLILVTLCGCVLMDGVRSLTMAEIGNLVQGPLWNTTTMSLYGNISGPIPPELGSLTNLTHLDLHNNSLSGPIPPQLGNLTNLTFLDLFSNSLSGSIPPQLGSLTGLQFISISKNNLMGPIPPQLGNLARLNYLYLHINSLSGPIPSQLGDLTRLTELSLSDNNLSGPIPSQLSNLTNLVSLYLYNNSLSGPIPPELGNFASLTKLKLSYNNLSGPIPPELGNLASLTELELSYNNLSGPIPLQLLKFGKNSFSPGNDGLCCTNCTFSSPCSVSPAPAVLPPPSQIDPSIAPFPLGAPPLPLPQVQTPSPSQGPLQSSPAASVGPIIGGVLAGTALLLALAMLGLCLHHRRKRMSALGPQRGLENGVKDEPQEDVLPNPPSLQERFTFKQLHKATDGFDNASVIGRGSFGTVYKGVLADGSEIAVKRLETRLGRTNIEQRSWKAEIEGLGKVRHKNLVTLLGVCVERGEQLLVFEYFAQGSLDRCLHHWKGGEPVLMWADRIHIARSICRGLIYLHNDIRPPIVHRDIKAANILLRTDDRTAIACIADFGLVHLVQDIGGETSTMVKGTVPYMAPEYLHGGPQFLTPKCDVYSFGLLSLELVSGRPVVRQLESGVVEPLLKVATDLMRQGRILELIDPTLGDKYDVQEALKYIHVAMACLRTDPSARPTMEDVGSQLALTSVVDSSFREEDVWGMEGSSTYLVTLSSSSGARSHHQSTALLASRFVTPR